MLSLLERVFPEQMKTPAWQQKIREIVPSYGKKLNENPQLLATEWATTAETLQLAIAHPDAQGGVSAAAAKFLGVFAFTQVPLAIAEGIVGILVFGFLRRVAPTELVRLGVLRSREPVHVEA